MRLSLVVSDIICTFDVSKRPEGIFGRVDSTLRVYFFDF